MFGLVRRGGGLAARMHLAPLRFNLLFTAMGVAVKRCSADADVVKDVVSTNKVKEKKKMGGQEAREAGERAR